MMLPKSAIIFCHYNKIFSGCRKSIQVATPQRHHSCMVKRYEVVEQNSVIHSQRSTTLMYASYLHLYINAHIMLFCNIAPQASTLMLTADCMESSYPEGFYWLHNPAIDRFQVNFTCSYRLICLKSKHPKEHKKYNLEN